MSEPIPEKEALEIVQRTIDLVEGRGNPLPNELVRLGFLFVAGWMDLFPALVTICGSEEKAMARLEQMKELVRMGVTDAQTTH